MLITTRTDEVSRPPSRSTGKERDTESGNDYFGARYYASTMGRFMSPDWSAKVEPVPYAKLGNPQSLNLYSYMLNNPMSGVDPDGHAGDSCKANPGLCAAIRDAVSNGGSIQDGYANWKTQQGVKDKQPKAPTDKEKSSGKLNNGGFIHYGNWGGPGWTGGRTEAYEDLSVGDQKKLAAPVDPHDGCYQSHDMCYSNGRVLSGGTSDLAGSQTQKQKDSQTQWERGCDASLAMCVHNLPSSQTNAPSRESSVVFTVRGLLRCLSCSDE
ncbi:MAG TPA: RHS repeat-associated core domain-containing protein [Terracidiphilus sp.]